MNKITKTVSVLLSVLMLFSVIQVAVFAADTRPIPEQLNLIIDADGRSTHWEDKYGNEVLLSTGTYSSKVRKAKAVNDYFIPPASYDSREHGVITPVKSQGSYGTCWAFATTSCVESSLIKAGLADTTIDLSEDHLVWFSKQQTVTDPNDGTYGDGTSFETMQEAFDFGGTWMDGISTYARGSGPVYDSDYPYATGNWNESERYKAEYRITDCTRIDSSSVRSIKKAIMEYGSVKSSYYNHTWYFNINTTEGYSAYYNPNVPSVSEGSTTLRTNHDITIIGWDDNFSRDNFKEENYDGGAKKPDRDGAWLVKNSWGANSPQTIGGYNWISYEEKEMINFSYYEVAPKDAFDNVYQYDGIGSFSSIFYPDYRKIYGANVFTAEGHELINRVGFYSTDAHAYKIRIYRLNSKSDLPTAGNNYVSEVSGVVDRYGYHTAVLTTPVEVNEGDVFSVAMEISVNEGSAKVPTEGQMAYPTSFDKEQSYIGTDWNYFDPVRPDSGYFKTAGNVCIKAMSVDIHDCEHTYGDWEITVPSTCIQIGSEQRICSACGEIETRETGFGSHTYSETVTPPTCISVGFTTYTCTVCNDTYTGNETEKTDHIPVNDPNVPPTCTKPGQHGGVHCEYCNAVLLEPEISTPNGHELSGEWTVVEDATCVKTGIEKQSCSVCHEEQTRVIPMKSHSYSETVIAPTCKAGGYSIFTCTACNDTYTGNETNKTAHTPVTIGGTKPTCTTPGKSEGSKCEVCGTILVAQTTIPTLKHELGEWNTVTAPKCTEPGKKTRKCNNCEYTESETIGMIAHKDTDNNGACDACGKDLTNKPVESNCGCLCHKSGIANFFWKIKLFFIKLFKTQQKCSCGIMHY